MQLHFPTSLFRESPHSLFRRLMKEYSCDYRVYTRKIYIIRSAPRAPQERELRSLLFTKSALFV